MGTWGNGNLADGILVRIQETDHFAFVFFKNFPEALFANPEFVGAAQSPEVIQQVSLFPVFFKKLPRFRLLAQLFCVTRSLPLYALSPHSSSLCCAFTLFAVVFVSFPSLDALSPHYSSSSHAECPSSYNPTCMLCIHPSSPWFLAGFRFFMLFSPTPPVMLCLHHVHPCFDLPVPFYS